MTMKDWVTRLNTFLQFNAKDIFYNLVNIGQCCKKISHKEYDKFKVKHGKVYKPIIDNFFKIKRNRKK